MRGKIRITALLNSHRLLLVGIFFSLCGKAQQIANYVTNGSFEEYISCSVTARLDLAKGWSSIDSLSNSGQYRSSCPQLNTVPYGALAFQYPRTGNAFALSGYLCEPPLCGPNSVRTYIKNRLKSTLQAGKTYCVKFYVNLTNNSPYAMDACGAYFCDGSIDTITHVTTPLVYLTPQINNPTNHQLADTLGWMEVSGTFVATGNEKYMLIGNFRSDANTHTSLAVPSESASVGTDLCIDDVSCIDRDLPAYAGNDTTIFAGDSLFIGRPPDTGINEDCTWYKLPDTAHAIDTIAGFWIKPVGTSAYLVKQNICGSIKWDTIVINMTAVGLEYLSRLNNMVSMYPVPADELLQLSFAAIPAHSETLRVIILNNLGQVMGDQEAAFKNKTLSIDTSQLPFGVYQLQIKSKAALALTRRFVISR